MNTKDGFRGIYKPMQPEQTRAHYDRWSGNYDSELAENGYATPARCAEALIATQTPVTARVLDFGCGTGISGEALKRVGFQTIDGCDLSAEMLKKAETKEIYNNLWQIEAGSILPTQYDVITAVGVISTGAAPPETLDTILGVLNSGGRLVLSFNDHALADPAYPARLKHHLSENAKLLFEEYGPHLPGLNLNAYVYVIEKS